MQPSWERGELRIVICRQLIAVWVSRNVHERCAC